MKLKSLILLSILSFGIAALWKMPASFAYQYIPQGNIQAQGLSGTIWKGEAKQMSLNKIVLQNISWSVDPLKSLTSLALKSKLQIQDPNLNLNGLVGINMSQTLTLDNMSIEANGAFASKFQKLAKISGDIKANINHLELIKGQLPIMDATIQWQQGELLAPIKIRPAGNYSILITPNDQGLKAKISSHKAPLILSGEANIDKKWKYNTHINIKAATRANRGLMNMLKMVVGKLEPNGSALIKQQGQLKAFY